MKLEEYREIKPYWQNRLLYWPTDEIRPFSHVKFTNGYSANSPQITVECKGIWTGSGKPEWGAVKGVTYFVIELGDVLADIKAETKQI